MKKQQARLITKHNWPWIIAIVLAVLLVGLVVHHHLQTSAQNKIFQDTQSWLGSVMDDAAKKVPGGERVSEAYCSRNSVKYGQGDRFCTTEEDILYLVSEDQFHAYVNKIQPAISNSLDVNLKNLGPDSLSQVIGGYAFRHGVLSCYITYYGLKNESSFSYLSKIRNFENGLRVSLSCSGPAMAEYFPNRD